MNGRQSDIALHLDGLSVEAPFDGRTLVDEVRLTIKSGETLCLVGESGSGKSMTARALMGLCPPELRVRMRNIAVAGNGTAPAQHMALVPQRALSALNPLLEIRTQMTEAFVSRRLGSRTEAEARAIQLLGEVGIESPEKRLQQYPHQFSGGQCQRILIAMALMCGPKLLIADEPTTALDPSSQMQVLRLLKRLRRSIGLGLLLITHDLAVAAATADRLAVMYAGQIVEDGPARQVLAAPSHPYTRALIGCTPGLRAGDFGHLPRPIPGVMQPRETGAPGCPFVMRCDVAKSECRQGTIANISRDGDRQVRCVLA